MDQKAKDLARYRISKAKEDFVAARELCKMELFSQSLNRSYYAMFHAARSLLALEKIDSKKHSGAINFFNEKFILTGVFDRKYSKYINSAFNTRMQTDYHDFYVACKNDSETQLKNAEDFIQTIEKYLVNVLEN
ncbi:MAG: HEPN domain-containing protein [Bacteroidota bacterium]